MPWYITEHILPPVEKELIFLYPDGHREKKKFVEDELYVGNGKYKKTAPTHWCYPEGEGLADPPPINEVVSNIEGDPQIIGDNVDPKREPEDGKNN